MSSSVLDVYRASHEDLERCIRVGVLAAWYLHKEEAPEGKYEEFMSHFSEPRKGAKSSSESVEEVEPFAFIKNTRDAERTIRNVIDAAQQSSLKVLQYMKQSIKEEPSKDEILPCAYKWPRSSPLGDEIAVISGNNSLEQAVDSFYTRIRTIRDEFKQRDANVSAADPNLADYGLGKECTKRKYTFSGEEAGGRCVDLHLFYAKYLNFKDFDKISYREYLCVFFKFTSKQLDKARAKPFYVRYLTELLDYLCDFACKTYPLRFADEELQHVELQFSHELSSSTVNKVDISKYLTAEDLCDKEDAELVKDVLRSTGLKCGGTPLQRAERLFQHHQSLKENHHVGETTRFSTQKSKESKEIDLRRQSQLCEKKIAYVCEEILQDVIEATIMDVQKKESLNYEELEMERKRMRQMIAKGAVFAGSSLHGNLENPDEPNDETEKPLYNPKDIPLGWDGKPMPYWLYKLQGLNHEFNCEICGNTVYRGPRAFERHFAESKHIQGLRCLNIAYDRNYYMITKIEDAVALNAKLSQVTSVTQRFQGPVSLGEEDDE